MTLDEFIAQYTELRDVQLVPWARDLCDRVIADARRIEVETATLEQVYDTSQAARLCGRAPKTIANMCARGVEGPFPNARKTSVGKGGKWIIPGCDIQALQKREAA